MKRLLAAISLSLGCACALAQTTEDAFRTQVAAFIDEWHDDAAHARLAYFDKMAPDGVYIGTDKTELWHREEFRAWAKRFFERGSAWAFKATQRHIYFTPDRSVVWWDELLDTQMGICQASGVLRRGDKGFAIEHYQLSVAVPNEVNKQVTGIIKEFEKK